MPAKYKKRADGRYATHVTIGTKSDGRPQRKTVYAKTMRELEEKAAELRRQVGAGSIVDDGGITVGQWAYEWLKTYKTGIAPSSFEVYEVSLRAHIIPALGHMKLKNVKPFHVQGLINAMSGKGLTRATEKAAMTAKQLFNRAVENGLITKSPAVVLEMPTKVKREKRALSEVEKNAFESAALDLTEKAFVLTMLYAGLRRGEVLALTWDDIDIDKKTISISKTWTVHGNEGVIKPSPKTKAGNREIPMTGNLHSSIKNLHASQAGSRNYLFTSSGNPMTLSEFRAFWKRISEKLALSLGTDLSKDVTPHIFRHTYATMLFYAGVDIKAAQYLLGHSSVAVTMEIYTHLDKSKLSTAADKLDEYISSSQKVVSHKD